MAHTHRFFVNCTESIDVVSVTFEIKQAVVEAKAHSGFACVYVPLAAAGLVILENDRDVHQAFRDLIVSLIPESEKSRDVKRPDRRSKTGFLHSHLRAACLQTSLVIPIIEGSLAMGPWQEVVMYDFDDRISRREIVVQIMAEAEESTSHGAGGARGGSGGSLPPGRARPM